MAAQAIGSENGIQKGDDQITFPSVYESVYKAVGKGFSFFPTAGGGSADLPEGRDLQAQWHEQKKRDADYMAGAKVQATRNSRTRAFSSHQGYYGMPHPVLGQRKFANPSLGAQESASGRHTHADAPFHWADAGGVVMEGMGLEGGVLRSRQGQEYGKKALLSRIVQLNAIDEAKRNFANNLPTPALATSERAATTHRPAEGDPASGDVREQLKVELNQLLRAIDDAMEGGPEGLQLTRFTYTDATRMLAILFRIAPRVDAAELEGLMGDVSNTLEDLIAVTDPDNDQGGPLTERNRAVAISLADLYSQIREYLRGMLKGVNLSPKERIDLSKNLVKSLGFSKLGQATPRNVQFAQAFEDIDGADGEEDDDDDDFNDGAPPREDTEQGSSAASTSTGSSGDGGPRRGLPVRNPRAGLTADERQTFGYNSGTYYPSGGRAPAQYFGEDGGGPEAAASANVSGPGFSAVADMPGGRPAFLEPAGRERGAPRAAMGPAAASARASAVSGLRRVWDRDTQDFNVATGVAPRASAASSPVARRAPAERASAVPSSLTSSRRSVAAAARAAPAPAARGLPTTAAELREQTRTMEAVRELVTRMNTAGIAHRVRASTSAPDLARKNIAKKLGIRGRF